MTVNPEQPVLDAIAELVDWQLEEGRRRGDGPAGVVDPVALRPEWLDGPSWRDMAAMPGFTPSPRMRLWSEDGSLIADSDRGDRIATDFPADQALVTLQCPQPTCDWSMPIEWREPGGGILAPVRRMEPDQVEAWLREHYARAHGISSSRGDSSSALGIDTITLANDE